MSNAEKLRSWMEKAGCQKIRSSGDNWISTCPFHVIKDGLQFALHKETGVYCCYSARCGEVGNIWKFLTEALGYDSKRAALASLNVEAGNVGDQDEACVVLPSYEARRRPEDWVPEDAEGLERQAILFEHFPNYLIDRGFTKTSMKWWGIGYDKEAERVTFAVRDRAGKMVGFSKRATKEDQQPKYLHLGFPKGKILYGEHQCKRSSTLYVGEGQLDAVALRQLHLKMKHETLASNLSFVSTMGSRVTPAQINLMRKYERVVLAFDNDEDGLRTTFKVGDRLLECMGPDRVSVVDWKSIQQFIHWPVKDPGDLIVADDIQVAWCLFSKPLSYDEFRISSLIGQR